MAKRRYDSELAAEVAPRVAPLLLLLRSAAEKDEVLREAMAVMRGQRLARLRHNARMLSRRRFLRRDVGIDEAAEILWTSTSPELYELLVLQRGWKAERFGGFVTTLLESALLSPK